MAAAAAIFGSAVAVSVEDRHHLDAGAAAAQVGRAPPPFHHYAAIGGALLGVHRDMGVKVMGDWPDIWLMRHGETVWNAERRMQGHQDSPLTALGRDQAGRQAVLMGRALAAEPGMTLIASPLGRAVETADIVFGGRAYQLDPRFREISVGAFEGRTRPELEAAFPDLFGLSWLGWYDRAPGGERLAELRARVTEGLSALTGPTAIVCHGITLRMARLVVLGWPDDRLEEMEVRQGAIHLMRNGQHQMLA